MKAVFRPAIIATVLSFPIAACSVASTMVAAPATATLINAQGATVGTATLTGNDDGSVSVAVEAAGIPAGTHGIHIHAVGSCQAPGFESAGGHFNPASTRHGLENPAGPHAGDLPNLAADASGRVSYRASSASVSLRPGATSLFDGDGSAIVIHAAADDNRTDPSGDSGARVACGVIRAGV